jgi:hypothetical protein
LFSVDALDECTSEAETAHLISLLGQALREPDLPVTHILLISRPEVHIGEAIYESLVSPVYEVPVKNSGKGAVFLSLRHLASICITTRSISARHGGHPYYDCLCPFRNARERSQSASDALKYGCQNWAIDLSRAPDPWHDTLNHVFKEFWNNHILGLKRSG